MTNYFDGMAPDQIIKEVAQLRTEVIEMKQQQRSYLDRRAKRGTQTFTDSSMEHQQKTLQKILDLIEKMAQEYQATQGP